MSSQGIKMPTARGFWERYIKAFDEGRWVYAELKVLELLPTWSEKKSLLGKHQYKFSMMTPSSLSSYINDLIDYMRATQIEALISLSELIKADLSSSETAMSNGKYAAVVVHHGHVLTRLQLAIEALKEVSPSEQEGEKAKTP